MLPGAEILMRCLEKEDVELIFGYPGGATLEIFDALNNHSCKIKHILVRHEQGAAHAASGYARASGKVGVCLATSGPGACNLLTGIATAYMDSIPIVALTGQVPTSMIGTDAFQEVDITGITDPISKHNYLVKDPADIPRIVREAFYIAKSGRPGPVVIDLPRNVMAGLAEYSGKNHQVDLRGYKPRVTGHAGQIKQICQLLQEAQRPLICAGGGVINADASPELIKLAETLQIPVVNTMTGIGSIPLAHPLALGMLGTYGLAQANYAVQKCDLFVAMGMRFTDRVTGNVEKFAPLAKIIHIDIDTAEIGKNVRADIPLVGDIKVVLDQLNDKVQKKKNPEWLAEIAEIKEKCAAMKEMNPQETDFISPRDVMNQLNELLPPACIVTTDVGQHQVWAAQMYHAGKPRSFICSGGLGTMGYGIPAAVGAQIARPHSTVVTITGDGSFQMGMGELGTALENRLPLKIILLNNQSLGMVKQLQDHYCGGRHSGVHFKKNPDFHYLALAFQALSLRVEKKEELKEKMAEFINHKGMAVLEVITSNKENVYPMVLGGCGLDQLVGLE